MCVLLVLSPLCNCMCDNTTRWHGCCCAFDCVQVSSDFRFETDFHTHQANYFSKAVAVIFCEDM
jgi:hypothetical protein